MKIFIIFLSLIFAVPAFSEEITYKGIWEGAKDDGKASQGVEVGQRWMLSNGVHHEGEILKKFGDSTFVGSSYTFIVEHSDEDGLVVYWVRSSSKQESEGSFVTILSPGSSKLDKGETRIPVGGDLMMIVSVK